MEYAASLSMCDAWLGKVLDVMDEYEIWGDTILIVNTDHGFLLGEHDWWAKCVQPFYGEVANSPLFIWAPRCACRNERRADADDRPAGDFARVFRAALAAGHAGTSLGRDDRG